MAQRAKPWFRLYSEALNDTKLKRIARDSKVPFAMVLGVWTTILCLANESPQRGRLMIADGVESSDEDIADATGLDVATVCDLLAAFRRMGMLDGSTISHWTDRQFDSDSSTERVQRYREKLSNADETLQQRSCDVIDTDTDTDTDKYTDSEPRKPDFPPMDDLSGSDDSGRQAPGVSGKTEQQEMFDALTTTCNVVDVTPKFRGWANKRIKTFLAADISPGDVLAFRDYWLSSDWRAKNQPLNWSAFSARFDVWISQGKPAIDPNGSNGCRSPSPPRELKPVPITEDNPFGCLEEP